MITDNTNLDQVSVKSVQSVVGLTALRISINLYTMPRSIKGRGAAIQPANRYLSVHVESDLEHVAEDDEYLAELGRPATQYLPDDSQSIVAENDSPDVGFRYSVNPYRGCSHGCSYCYARPGHEYLGLSAGLDFETKVLVKHRAAELFREFLCAAQVAAGDDRVLGCHRLLPTGRAGVQNHASLCGGCGRVQSTDRDHHEECACDSRYRPVQAACGAQRDPGVAFDHDA